MSIYDKASLVLIPSGTKTSKVYSQKPTNGDGDFTFSRSTAATRVNASGNIEKETQNLLTYSKNLASSGWTLASATSSSAADFDGGNNANEITGSGFIYQSISGFTGVHTFSVYAKAGNWEGLRLRIDIASNSPQVFFNLSDGSYFSNSNDIDVSITDIGNNWYRCTLTGNISAPNNFRIYPADSTNLGGTGSVILYKAQAEQGLVARDYVETTTTAIYGGITDNVPRLDYTDSSCPALLLEPQRTNLVGQSEYFGASDWVKTGLTIASNEVTSPDGNLNGTEVTISNGFHFLFDIISVSPSTTYTFSWYAKRGTATNVSYSVYDDTNGVDIISSTSYYSQLSDTEWKRISVQFTTSATTTSARPYVLRDGGQTGTISIYGAQLEVGSYATSYIPTYGSAVTRSIDNMQIASGISDLLPQGTGTMYVEGTIVDAVDTEGYLMRIEQASFSNTIFITRSTAGNLFASYRDGNSTLFVIQKNNVADTFKAAFAFESGNSVLYVNGEQVGTSLVTYTPSVTYDDIRIGGYSANIANMSGLFSQALVFKTRLSNEELATLTTID